MMRRNTIQRSLVLEAVNKLQNHATADEVYEMIAKEHPTISRGTVYRNLNQLSEMGQVRKLDMPEGPDRFDHRCDHHYHTSCVECGRVFDVEMKYIDDLENKIEDTHGFTFTGHNIFFQGICPECQDKQKA